jgi:hypothetical protein
VERGYAGAPPGEVSGVGFQVLRGVVMSNVVGEGAACLCGSLRREEGAQSISAKTAYGDNVTIMNSISKRKMALLARDLLEISRGPGRSPGPILLEVDHILRPLEIPGLVSYPPIIPGVWPISRGYGPDRLCKLDMEQHGKWVVYGADGLGDNFLITLVLSCTRMRPKLHLPALGHAQASRITGIMA